MTGETTATSGKLGRPSCPAHISRLHAIRRINITGKESPDYLMGADGAVRSMNLRVREHRSSLWEALMLGYRWSYFIPVLCGVGGLTWSTEASAFQYPPLSDDLNPRQIHGADAWIDGEQRSTGNINQSPADLGQIQGMWSRTSDGNPASGDSFPLMQAGSLPGGLSPHGFNGSGMIPCSSWKRSASVDVRSL